MCEKCPIDQRYPYYGFPVTPDSRKLRDEESVAAYLAQHEIVEVA